MELSLSLTPTAIVPKKVGKKSHLAKSFCLHPRPHSAFGRKSYVSNRISYSRETFKEGDQKNMARMAVAVATPAETQLLTMPYRGNRLKLAREALENKYLIND